MKRLFKIFELSKNEQRVVLIVMLILVVIAFVEYQRRVHHSPAQVTSETKSKPSPSPLATQHDQ
jgi:hypothetical protein